jgi:hypothetical protein
VAAHRAHAAAVALGQHQTAAKLFAANQAAITRGRSKSARN